jgi:hypothetical protein
MSDVSHYHLCITRGNVNYVVFTREKYLDWGNRKMGDFKLISSKSYQILISMI